MKIKKIEVFPIRVKNNFDIGRKSDTKNINTAMLEIKNLKKLIGKSILIMAKVTIM